MLNRLIATPLMALALGCGLAASEEEIKERFADHVNAANHCAVASDCAIASPGCPLGCFVAVRADRKVDVEAKARALIRDYERTGRSCQFDCPAPGPLVCTAGRCAAGIASPLPSRRA